MPCHVEISNEEREMHARVRAEKDAKLLQQALDGVNSRNDVLTAENDMLRETLINISDHIDIEEYIDSHALAIVINNQITHREEDLRRLKEVFKNSGDFDTFEKAILADPTKPLMPQLGFNPDDF